MESELLVEGQRWPFRFNHDWVLQGPDVKWKEKMMDALRYSPLGVAVHAWRSAGDLYIRPAGARDTHWCVIFGYVEGRYWKCFDSYDHSVKHLAWDFGFSFAKRVVLTEKATLPQKNWLVEIIENIVRALKEILINPFGKFQAGVVQSCASCRDRFLTSLPS